MFSSSSNKLSSNAYHAFFVLCSCFPRGFNVLALSLFSIRLLLPVQPPPSVLASTCLCLTAWACVHAVPSCKPPALGYGMCASMLSLRTLNINNLYQRHPLTQAPMPQLLTSSSDGGRQHQFLFHSSSLATSYRWCHWGCSVPMGNLRVSVSSCMEECMSASACACVSIFL